MYKMLNSMGKGYGIMTNDEISELLNKESYRIWDTSKVIKNQDYHDGLVKGLKMAAKFVSTLDKK